jgi:hypothetical protein
MSPVGRTLRVFGIYLIVVALPLLFVPNVVLSLLALPATEEPWIRVLGLVVLVLGTYYVGASKDHAPGFTKATVIGRLLAATGLVVIAVTWNYWAIALFAIPDSAGAVWTWTKQRRAAPSARSRAGIA